MRIWLSFFVGMSAVLPVLLAPTPPAPILGTSSWRMEPVGTFGSPSEPSIALGPYGLPHVVYCPPGNERYATKTPSGWSSELVTQTANFWGCGQLAFGPGGVPHVTTIPARMPAGDLAPLYGRRFNGTWDLTRYPGGTLHTVNSRGEPQVTTDGFLGGDKVALRYLTRVGGVWLHEDVEVYHAPWGLYLEWASLALDARDNPRILYYDDARNDVRYAYRDDSGWHVEVVDHGGPDIEIGRGGELALLADGTPVGAYVTGFGSALRYARRTSSGWVSEVVDDTPQIVRYPTLAVRADDVPCVAYEWRGNIQAKQVFNESLLFRCREESGWTREVVVEGFAHYPDPLFAVAEFPSLAVDRCGNPHLAFSYNLAVNGDQSGAGVYYATKGEPCETRLVHLDLDPNTLNLKSRGNWVTAYVEAENATVADIDPGSLRLNGIAATWTRTWDDTLVAKFDRATFAATVSPGEAVEVTLIGRWRDGGTFTATDTIRVIRPGR